MFVSQNTVSVEPESKSKKKCYIKFDEIVLRPFYF